LVRRPPAALVRAARLGCALPRHLRELQRARDRPGRRRAARSGRLRRRPGGPQVLRAAPHLERHARRSEGARALERCAASALGCAGRARRRARAIVSLDHPRRMGGASPNGRSA
jgi:hypothetical protein